MGRPAYEEILKELNNSVKWLQKGDTVTFYKNLKGVYNRTRGFFPTVHQGLLPETEACNKAQQCQKKYWNLFI